MNLSYFILLTFVFFCLVTMTFGRTLSYNKINDDDTDDNDDKRNSEMTKSSSSEYSDEDIFPNDLSKIINNDNFKEDSADSFEERLFHERSPDSSSRPTRMISAQTRQALIDIIQKAYDQGWRPSLKHYIPATRFGRHRR